MKQYSNNIADHEAVVAWRTAAILDGWTLENVYKSEPAESYGRIRKDGFSAHVCARVRADMVKYFPGYVTKWEYNSEITIWGPDGLSINAPDVYSWEAISKGTRHCSVCGKDDVETVRVAFCNRVCLACAPQARQQMETPGWCE